MFTLFYLIGIFYLTNIKKPFPTRHQKGLLNSEVNMTQIQNTSQPTEQELVLYQTLIKRQDVKRLEKITLPKKSKSGLVIPALIVIAMCAGGLFSCTADRVMISAVAKEVK